MRNKFPGHFASSTTDFDKLWGGALVVLDANVLLNFYRYSDATRETFIGTLREFKGRLWVPHRAAYEYFSNRLDVIGQQKKKYDDTIKDIGKLKKDLEGSRQHPFVDDEVLKKAQGIFDELERELSSNREVHERRINNDEIMLAIDDLIGDEIGEPYTVERQAEIIKSGEVRYREKIPPGFIDGKSKKPETEALKDQLRPYGDYLVWLQILDKAKGEGRSVILVTDDNKEDWWEIVQGKTIGPRPELVEEFKSLVNQDFFMYQPDQFLIRANQNANTQPSTQALQEIQDVSISSQGNEDWIDKYLAGQQWEMVDVSLGGGETAMRPSLQEQLEVLYESLRALRRRHINIAKQWAGLRHGPEKTKLRGEMRKLKSALEVTRDLIADKEEMLERSGKDSIVDDSDLDELI